MIKNKPSQTSPFLKSLLFTVFTFLLFTTFTEEAFARDLKASLDNVWKYVFDIGKVVSVIGIAFGFLGVMFSDHGDIGKRVLIRSCISCAGFFSAPTIVNLVERFFGGR